MRGGETLVGSKYGVKHGCWQSGPALGVHMLCETHKKGILPSVWKGRNSWQVLGMMWMQQKSIVDRAMPKRRGSAFAEAITNAGKGGRCGFGGYAEGFHVFHRDRTSS